MVRWDHGRGYRRASLASCGATCNGGCSMEERNRICIGTGYTTAFGRCVCVCVCVWCLVRGSTAPLPSPLLLRTLTDNSIGDTWVACDDGGGARTVVQDKSSQPQPD